MDPRELDLNEIDALLGEDDFDTDMLGADIEEDSDDFDDLLAGDDFDFGMDDEEDSLEEILGAIDNQYLSEKEQVFLQNKAFLDSKNPTQLDDFFMKFQETLYGAMDEYHNDDEDLFGAAGGPESMDDLELEVDLMSGSCFGSDAEEEAFLEDCIINGETDDDLEDEFGIDFRAIGNVVNKAGRGIQRFAKKNRKALATAAAVVATAPVSLPTAAIAAPTALIVGARDNAKTKRNYIRKINDLNRCVKRFEKIARKVNSDVAIKLVSGQRAFLRRPFTVMAASSIPDKKIVSAVLAGKPLQLKDRRLVALAKRCDAKYNKLRSIYRGLKAKGRATGVQSPTVVFKGIMKNLASKAQKSAKASGGVIPALAVASVIPSAVGTKLVKSNVKRKPAFRRALKQQAKRMLAIRKANRVAAMKDRAEMRQKMIAAAKQNRQNRIIKRKLAEERKADAAMVQANPYMDAADMAALDRARAERMPKPVKGPRSLGRPRAHLVKPAIPPKPLVKKPRASVLENALSKAQADIAKLEAALKRHAALHRKSIETQQKFAKGSTPYNAQYAKTKKYAQILSNLNEKIKAKKASVAKFMQSMNRG
jgi:hypothetical protein